MAWADDLREQLEQEIQKPSGPVGIIAYRFCLDERQTTAMEGSYLMTGSGALTLIWQDGSVSSHRLSPFLSKEERLPIPFWQSSRYFDRNQRRLRKPPTFPLPDIPLHDPNVFRHFKQLTACHPAEDLRLELTLHKRTVCHSHGLFLQAEMTAVRSARLPFVYESRRLPNEKEAAFLKTESDWISLLTPKPLCSILLKNSNMKLLLAPDAFRSLLYNTYCRFLHQGHTRSLALAFADEMAGRSGLTVLYDPLVPWSRGSFLFTSQGVIPAASDVFQAPALVPSDCEPASFHWKRPAPPQPFREWLVNQPDVLFIPEWRLPGVFQPRRSIFAWIPRAYRFQQGRLTEQGNLTLPVSLMSILSSPALESVQRPGWDTAGIGLAVAPYHP